jgi:hypothetical protein
LIFIFKKSFKRLRILFDSGCGATLKNVSLVKNKKMQKTETTKWITKAGNFSTTQKCEIKFKLPAFHENRNIT